MTTFGLEAGGARLASEDQGASQHGNETKGARAGPPRGLIAWRHRKANKPDWQTHVAATETTPRRFRGIRGTRVATSRILCEVAFNFSLSAGMLRAPFGVASTFGGRTRDVTRCRAQRRLHAQQGSRGPTQRQRHRRLAVHFHISRRRLALWRFAVGLVPATELYESCGGNSTCRWRIERAKLQVLQQRECRSSMRMDVAVVAAA